MLQVKWNINPEVLNIQDKHKDNYGNQKVVQVD